jgi:para-nitrobenzyl esterase
MPVSHLRESWYGRIAAEKFGERLGTDLATLRAKSTAEILKATGLPDMTGDRAAAGEEYMPVVDGLVLPDDPAKLFASGSFHRAALLAGTNRDEGTLLGGPPVRDQAGLRKFAVKSVGAQADALMATYPTASDAEAHDTACRMMGDFVFLQGTRSVLRAVSKINAAYQYEFTRVTGIGSRIHWGAYHASEIPYVFGTLPDSAYGTVVTFLGDFSVAADSYNDYDAKLSKSMSAAWIRFAKTGDPNGPGLPEWPKFKSPAEAYLEFGETIEAKAALRRQQLDTWTEYMERQRERATSGSTAGRQ